jgi:hypothetical protein
MLTGFISSQFEIMEKVELKIIYESGFIGKLKEITLIGENILGESRTYSKDININKINYTIYDVDPGTYLVIFTFDQDSEDNLLYITSYNVSLIVNSDTGYIRNLISVQNEIEVKKDRNLKLEIYFTGIDDVNGFYKKIEKSYKNFEYSALYFNNSNIFENSQNKSNSNAIEKIKTYSDSKITKHQEKNEIPRVTGYDFCLTPKAEKTIPLSSACNSDGGYIEVIVPYASLKNEGEFIESKNSRRGRAHGLGEVYDKNGNPTGGFINGNTKINFKISYPKREDTTCDIDKCRHKFVFYPRIILERAIWDQSEMNRDQKCVKISNTTYCFSNQKYSDCFFESVKMHELCHCAAWEELANTKLKNIASHICDNLKSSSCCNTPECIPQYRALRARLVDQLERKLKSIFNKQEGNQQEPICNALDVITFFLHCR